MIPPHPLRPPTTAHVFACYRYATALPIGLATACDRLPIALCSSPPYPPSGRRVSRSYPDRGSGPAALALRSVPNPSERPSTIKTTQPRHNTSQR
jgi:hypothetical protein